MKLSVLLETTNHICYPYHCQVDQIYGYFALTDQYIFPHIVIPVTKVILRMEEGDQNYFTLYL